MYFDARGWMPEMEDEARELQQKYAILVKADQFEFRESEFTPSTPIQNAFDLSFGEGW